MQGKEILTVCGRFALVDEEVYEKLSIFTWRADVITEDHWYVFRMDSRNRQVYMHRELMGTPPLIRCCVDHINGYGWDNRKENLRWTTPQFNARPRYMLRSRVRQEEKNKRETAQLYGVIEKARRDAST